MFIFLFFGPRNSYPLTVLLAHWHKPNAVTVVQGKVSILAHSLGSVLCYEILCNQPHLFNHLEVNMHSTPAPTDPSRPSDPPKSADTPTNTQDSTASAGQQQPLQQQKRKGSTETAFAPMSSRDLEDSYQAARSSSAFPMPGAPKIQPKAGSSFGMAPAWKDKEEVRCSIESPRACSRSWRVQ